MTGASWTPKNLAEVRVLIVGAGGLGCPVALALAQSGLGTLGLCDPDRIDLSNLPRQVLYRVEDVGKSKVDVAAERIAELCPETRVVPIAKPFDSVTGRELLESYDAVVEGSDQIETKFVVNDLAVEQGLPVVIGGALRWSGQLVCWAPDRVGGCYRCLFEAPPAPETIPTCEEAGILGPVCGVMGGMQAAAVLTLLGHKERCSPVPGFVYTYEALTGQLRSIPFRPRPDCPCILHRHESP